MHQMLRHLLILTGSNSGVMAACKIHRLSWAGQHWIRRTLLSQATDSSTNANVQSQLPIAKYELFVDPNVQSLLKQLTAENPKITLPDITKLKRPREITLMTKDQLEKARKLAVENSRHMMEMPPVLPERKDCTEVLSRDADLVGLNQSSYVFTDITLGLPERQRSVVVRTPDGTLSTASWETRDRIMQIYYPRGGRRIKPAPMFEPENLNRLIADQRYRYLLDCACCQFEPDHPQYIKITHMVYENCDSNGTYDLLNSTRHYGPMIFYFVLHKRIANMLKYIISRGRLEQCLYIAELYSIVWDLAPPDTPGSDSNINERVASIQAFLARENMMSSDLKRELHVLLMRESGEVDDRESGEVDERESGKGDNRDVEGTTSSDKDNSDSKDLDSDSDSDSSDSDSDSDSDSSDSDSDDKDGGDGISNNRT